MAYTTRAELETQVKRLQRSLDRAKAKCDVLGNSLGDALEREQATAEILGLISRSSGQIQPVVDGIADTALRLIGGVSAAVTRLSGGMLHLAAFTSTSKAGDDTLRRQFPCPLDKLPGQARAIRSRMPYWIADTERSATNREVARARGYRSAIFIPLLRNKEPIGAISVSRRDPGAFSDHQIALLKTFADQAVIAIENARLFNEAKESLEQQTAISEILKVMSASPTDVRPVLDTVAERAARICEANDVRILLTDNAVLRYSAGIGEMPEQTLGETRPIDRRLVSGRAVVDRVPVQVEDLSTPEARKEFPLGSEMRDRYGHRTVVAVPLMRDDRALGVILLRRMEVRPFNDKQIALLKTFADQAAIAIENVRLFNETREALERQTATAEVLRVISSSPGNLEPVYRTILDGIGRLCEANIEALFLHEGGTLGAVATNGTTQQFATHLARSRFRPSHETTTRLAALERRVVHVPDLLADDSFAPKPRDLYERENVRTVLSVPMLREGALIGVITAWRREVRPFTERQVDLVKTFADQAVIAIENVRLFNELQARNAELSESLEQQTATSEILRIISRSPTDTQPVFDAIVQSGASLFKNARVGLRLISGDRMETIATTAPSGFGTNPVRVGDESMPATRALRLKEVVQIPDIFDAEDWVSERTKRRYAQTGRRAGMVAPMLRENVAIGTINVSRSTPGAFSEKEVALLKTFADQAVIAIENVRLFKELEARNAELTESLDQQTATARILQVISSSPTDLQPVFDTILDNACRLCEAHRGALHLFDGEVFTLVSDQGATAAFAEYRERERVNRAGALSALGQLGERRCVMHIPDLAAWPGYVSRDPMTVASVELEGTRTYLGVPMLKDGKLLGAITFRRQEVRPFSDKQIALLQTFAAQAVIAIENVRLFKELEARNAELTESLEQQTATSEILRVIASSLTDTQPVFDAIVRSGARLFEGANVSLRLVSGNQVEFVASSRERDRTVFALDDSRYPSTRAIRDKQVVIVDDMLAEDWITDEARERARRRGFRGLIAAPLMRGNEAIGTLAMNRAAPGPFTQRQTDLLKTFADQAVIAIENVRLFKELQTRNEALTESLERQTATSEILRVISRSPTEVQPVFDTIVNSAKRLLGGFSATLRYLAGDDLELVAFSTTTELGDDAIRSISHLPLGDDPIAQVIRDRAPRLIEDTESDPGVGTRRREVARARGYRSMLIVPMLSADRAIGAITVTRREPGPFTDREVALLQTFADQAVIAIENVRLFKELQARNAELSEALEQQTATAEVLKIISRSTFDLEPVLQTLVENAAKLCGATRGAIYRIDANGNPALGVTYNMEPQALAALRADPPTLDRGRPVGRAILDRRVLHIPDLLQDPEFHKPELVAAGVMRRTMLIVPMLREGVPIGAMALSHGEQVKPFTEKQIELVQTFADQAVIAIENVRLFKELEARNTELTESLEQQTATAEILRVISSSPTDIQPVLDAVAESAARLCESNDVVIRRVEQGVLRVAAHHGSVPITQTSIDIPISREWIGGVAVIDRCTIHVDDVMDPQFRMRYPLGPASRYREDAFRTILIVPLMREDAAIGTIALRRPQVRPFSEKQIKLLETFAAQAVIAIENVRLFKELQARNAEISEALEQQTATAAILQAISSSPTNLQPVFDAILDKATQLCDAPLGSLGLYDGEHYRIIAARAASPEVAVWMIERGPYRPLPDGRLGRLFREGRPIHTPDLMEGIDYQLRRPITVHLVERLGVRTHLSVPMVKEGRAIGSIMIYRTEVRPFTQKQIDLVCTFANQATIAIENVRLFKELEARNAALAAALEQQTATSELLKIIGRSTFDLQPVFETLAEYAVRLCEAKQAFVFRSEGGFLRVVASYNASKGLRSFFEENPIAPGRGSVAGRAALDAHTIHVHDVLADPEYTWAAPQVDPIRTVLTIPMLRGGEVLGVIGVNRHEVQPFADTQIALLETFADQAAIAIENVRLFKELQAQTEALSRSVNQLTALGEVGHAISSTLDLETVLQTIVLRALQLTGLDSGSIYEYDQQAQLFRLQAAENMQPEIVEHVRKAPIRIGDGIVGRTGVTCELTQIPDLHDDSYQSGRREMMLRAGYRALLAVPLMREELLLGVLVVSRKTPGEFGAEIVNLLKTFATQSALAIQNARLFREIEEKSRQLEVASQHKSQFLASMSHELRTPLNAMLGFNEMLLGEIYGTVPEDMRDPLTDIQSSGRHLLRLINNVLDLAKIEAGRMELSLADYSVQDTVESVRSTLHPLAADKGLEFTVNVPNDIPFAYGDFGRITQCLMNLAGNSLKFTREGSVRIAVDLRGNLLVYRVKDTGIGIAPDKIDSLFTEFKQTDATIASEFGGTGLGLSITRKFVEMHGGRIWVESELGKGSEFIFEIPLRAGEGVTA